MCATRSSTTAMWWRACRTSARSSSRSLTEIPPEHRACPVVFSAHGVPKSVPADAAARNLFYLDATCPLVSKVHKQAMRHQRLGRHVLLIGHAGHPEVIGTMGQLADGAVTLIETEADVAPSSRSIRQPSALSRRRRCRSKTRRTSSGRSRSASRRSMRAGRRVDLLCHHQPPGGGQGNGRQAPTSSSSSGRRTRRTRAVWSRLPSGPAPRCRCWCSAPPRSLGTELGAIAHARPFRRRVGAGDHRRRDHRRFPRPLRRHRRARRDGDRDREFSGDAGRCAMSSSRAADMAFVNGIA